MRLEGLSDRTRREWAKRKDHSTPSQRRLLDQLQQVRPDMAPLKASTTSDDGQRVSLYRPMPMYSQAGPIGVYGVTWDWVRKEIRRCRAEARREHQKDVNQHIGAYI